MRCERSGFGGPISFRDHEPCVLSKPEDYLILLPHRHGRVIPIGMDGSERPSKQQVWHLRNLSLIPLPLHTRNQNIELSGASIFMNLTNDLDEAIA